MFHNVILMCLPTYLPTVQFISDDRADARAARAHEDGTDEAQVSE